MSRRARRRPERRDEAKGRWGQARHASLPDWEQTERRKMADAHAKPHHDYHLVDPSPWPAVGSVSAFLMALGAITWMHHIFAAAPYIFGVGTIGMLYTMLGWWRDVTREATSQGFHTRVVQISHRYGMILFIASEVMFFVAWFWAYFNTALFPADMHQVVRDQFLGGVWPPKGIETFDPWHLPLLNTLILLTSGTTVTWAHHALLENDRQGLKWGLLLTIVLGAAFTCVQAYEYSHAAFHYSGHIYGATFFMATGFHGAHVLIGTTFLIVCLIRAYLGHFTPTQHLGFEFAAWYWHFVDVVWLFLFACIYVWGAGAHMAAAGHH
jgi:cytochrome c oxidase subunit III